jgi:hypothetical protein
MISDQYKCIFIHIPKTAGQSIERFILNLHGLPWEEREPLLLRHNPEPNKGPEWLAHLTAQEYTDCEYLTENTFSNYFSFSFVRNPWAKLVSEYHYGEYDKKYSFKKFILSGFPEKDSYSDSYRHLIPQHEFLLNKDGKLMVDFVGKFESLQEDFNHMCQKIGIEHSSLPYTNNLPKVNGRLKRKLISFLGKSKPSKKHYTSYYDKESERIVSEIYTEDIKLFNYSFGA